MHRKLGFLLHGGRVSSAVSQILAVRVRRGSSDDESAGRAAAKADQVRYLHAAHHQRTPRLVSTHSCATTNRIPLRATQQLLPLAVAAGLLLALLSFYRRTGDIQAVSQTASTATATATADAFEALGRCTTLECVSALHPRLSAAGAKFNFPHFFLVSS